MSAVARQGLPAALAATLGTGPNSSQVRQAMMLDGVELVVEELVGDIGTCTTLIEPSGRRSFITTEGVEAEPQIEDLEHLELVHIFFNECKRFNGYILPYLGLALKYIIMHNSRFE